MCSSQIATEEDLPSTVAVTIAVGINKMEMPTMNMTPPSILLLFFFFLILPFKKCYSATESLAALQVLNNYPFNKELVVRITSNS